DGEGGARGLGALGSRLVRPAREDPEGRSPVVNRPQSTTGAGGTAPLALVTGASRGIGAAVALRLAKDGFHVLVNYSSNESKAREVLDRIQAAGGSGELLGFNVADSTQVAEKIGAITKSRGPLAVLVNNAG